MSPDSFQIRIGEPGWVEWLDDFTSSFSPGYWDGFVPCPLKDISECEAAIGRTLPDDFKQFLTEIGAGSFPGRNWNRIWTPSEIARGIHGPLWMILGSSGWATEEDHREFYRTRGAFNPAPDLFTPEALRTLGFNLLDLVQIGSDGSCGYHNLYVGPPPRPFGCCTLHTSSIERRFADFSEFLSDTVTRHVQYDLEREDAGNR